MSANAYAIFVPGTYAPISNFVTKKGSESEALVFEIHPTIVEYVVTKRLQAYIAQKGEGETVFYFPIRNLATFEALTTSNPGNYVIVADGFVNSAELVTHWEPSLNDGRGGFMLGAVGEMGNIFVDNELGKLNALWSFFDYDYNNPLAYRSNEIALFNENPYAMAPSFESYLGENYAVMKFDAKSAVFLSDMIRERTGFPVIHKNHPWALNLLADPEQQVSDGLPAFQIVHNYVIAANLINSSLATFMLPPLWSRESPERYPIAFDSFYDNNQNLAIFHGPLLLEVAGELFNEGKGGAISVLWNGGGFTGTMTGQPSAYANCALLFDVVREKLNGDPFRVVMMGKSRGATAALQLAANPDHLNYNVDYVIAFNPLLRMGELCYDYINTAYPGNYGLVDWHTGYKYAWRSDWMDLPGAISPAALMLYNFYGTFDRDVADQYSPWSDVFVDSLKARGTSVSLVFGSHDLVIPMDMCYEYYNKLLEKGVPTQFRINFRSGHAADTDDHAQLKWALENLLSETPQPYADEQFFYKPLSTELWYEYEAFEPAQPPIFLEAPSLMIHGHDLHFNVMGGEGDICVLYAYRVSDGAWLSLHDDLIVMPETISGFSSQKIYFDKADELPEGTYIYFLYYSRDQGVTWNVLYGNVPYPSSPYAAFEVVAEEPFLSGWGMAGQYSGAGRGWGVSEY